jgi:hypothetical protein
VPLLDEELLALFFYFFLGAEGLTALTGGRPLDFPIALVMGFLISFLFFFLSSSEEEDDELLEDSTLIAFYLLFLSDFPLLEEFFLPFPGLPPYLFGLPPPLAPPLFLSLDELELLDDLLLELLDLPLPAPSVIGY